MKTGDEYILTHSYTTEDGKAISAGTICYYVDGRLFGYDDTSTYIQFRSDLVPKEHIRLYRETPYNSELRKRRERIATAAMQAILNGWVVNTMVMEQMMDRARREGFKTMGEIVASDAVGYADAMIKELDKEHE